MPSIRSDLRILLFGKNGQLGSELQRTLASLGPITAVDYQDVDFMDSEALRTAVQAAAPELIINAAAYTDVDKSESAPGQAYAINATAPGILAEESRRLGAGFIHYSTDYVFDGAKGTLYHEADEPNPLNVYGASKLAGEQAVQDVDGAYLILRTAWVFSRRGSNFVNKVLEWSREHPILRIVDDQISNPTWARSLAEATARLLAQAGTHPSAWLAEHKGLYHLAGNGHASRLEWARLILDLEPHRAQQVVKEVLPAHTSDFPTPARRPLLSALDCNRFVGTFGFSLPPWREALRLCLSDR